VKRTKEQARKWTTDWNRALREGRVVRFEGESFRSYLTPEAAREAVDRARRDGWLANIVEIPLDETPSVG
jgi:hypothetical protein